MKKSKVTQTLPQATGLLSDERFNELLHTVVAMDRSYFEEEEVTAFIPQLIVFGPKNEQGKNPSTLISLPEFDEESKQDNIIAAGGMFFEKGQYSPLAVFMSSEAWMGGLKDKEGESIRPSEDPRKQEVLITAGLAVDKRANMAISKINRIGEKNLISLGTTQFHEYEGKESIETRLLGFFFFGYALAMTRQETKN